jgi:hypothetical protein
MGAQRRRKTVQTTEIKTWFVNYYDNAFHFNDSSFVTEYSSAWENVKLDQIYAQCATKE